MIVSNVPRHTMHFQRQICASFGTLNLVLRLIDPFHVIGVFLYPLKISEIRGGVERDQWYEIGYNWFYILVSVNIIIFQSGEENFYAR